MHNLVEAIIAKHRDYGIEVFAAVTPAAIQAFEARIGFALPEDFRTFYRYCNGFGCTEDIFNMSALEEITQYSDNYGDGWCIFAEYMIYSEGWALRLSDTGQYEIFNTHYPGIVLTNSLSVFLEHFLSGGVFQPGGLYTLQEERGIV